MANSKKINLNDFAENTLIKVPFKMVDVDQTRNLRERLNYNDSEIEMTTKKIIEVGNCDFLPPIKVVVDSEGDKFRLFHGYRRMTAIENAVHGIKGKDGKLSKLEKAPKIMAVVVKDDELDEHVTHITENNGKKLTGAELFKGIKYIKENKPDLKDAQISNLVCKSQPYISQCMKIIKDDSLVNAVSNGTITAYLAYKIIKHAEDSKEWESSQDIYDEMLKLAKKDKPNKDDNEISLSEKHFKAVIYGDTFKSVKTLLTDNGFSMEDKVSISDMFELFKMLNKKPSEIYEDIANAVESSKDIEDMEENSIEVIGSTDNGIEVIEK